ncbi:hypothetical protein ACFP65_03425 [Marinilactibacillus sp. GCM10026970]|uniref:hypothetical protein n=1 Tax=Marinilactibacillus sp. GCM10026970 TaxID=3252642 RepID=UPI003610C641
MSDRDRQNKHDRDSNISSSMYSRVNIGNNLNNSRNGTRHTDIAGSMNNPDEKLKNTRSSSRSFLYTVLFFLLGIGFSFAYMYLSALLFNDYLTSPESKELLPTIFSLTLPFVLGFLSAKGLLALVAKFTRIPL